MNKKMLAIVIIILALIGGGVAYLVANGTDEPTAQNTTTSQSTSPDSTATNQEAAQEGTSNAAGQYIAYDADKVTSTPGTKLLFFHAPWCPQCRAIEASINNSTIPSGVTIFKVDYDTNQALRQKYGVTLQTTFVKVDDQGNLVEKFVAYDEPTFESVKRNLL